MNTEGPKYFGLKLEWLGYTVAVFSIFKCICNVIMYSVLLEVIRQKLEEYISIGIYFKILGLLAAFSETVASAFVIIGINETMPWMLIPWMIMIVMMILACFASFILYLMKNHWCGVVPPILEILRVSSDILGFVIVIKLYKWLRRKQQEME